MKKSNVHALGIKQKIVDAKMKHTEIIYPGTHHCLGNNDFLKGVSD